MIGRAPAPGHRHASRLSLPATAFVCGIGEPGLVAIGQRQPGEQRRSFARRATASRHNWPASRNCWPDRSASPSPRPAAPTRARTDRVGLADRSAGTSRRATSRAARCSAAPRSRRRSAARPPSARGADDRFLLGHLAGRLARPAQMHPLAERARRATSRATAIWHRDSSRSTPSPKPADHRALRDHARPPRPRTADRLSPAGRLTRRVSLISAIAVRASPGPSARRAAIGIAIDRHRHLVGPRRDDDRLRARKRRRSAISSRTARQPHARRLVTRVEGGGDDGLAIGRHRRPATAPRRPIGVRSSGFPSTIRVSPHSPSWTRSTVTALRRWRWSAS